MSNRSKVDARRSLLLCLVVLGIITAVIVVPYQYGAKAAGGKGRGFSERTVPQEDLFPFFDIRMQGTREAGNLLASFRNAAGRNASTIADIRDAYVQGENALRTRIPLLKTEYNETLRIPEIIGPDPTAGPAFLNGRSSARRAETLLNFIRDNNGLVGINASTMGQLSIFADYMNPAGNMGFVELEQSIDGIPVFQGTIKAGFSKHGEMVRIVNNFAPGLDSNTLTTNFGNPNDAVRAAAGFAGFTLPTDLNAALDRKVTTTRQASYKTESDPVVAEKIYFPTEPGVARAAWRVLMWKPVQAYYVIVDAETGALLWRKNITNDQTQTATYGVYLSDSPAPSSPSGSSDPSSGFQAAAVARTTITLIGNEAPNSGQNNLGWITDGGNVTTGNNVDAGLDIDGTNGIDAAGRATGSPTRSFDFVYNPAPGIPAPGDAPTGAAYRNGAVTNIFVATNRYHDALYALGFTEPARNFQGNNFGRGGAAGADYVRAEAQDSSGTNNANFATPADGSLPRMQMYIFTGPTPDRDGDLDAEISIHEMTHGLSNRLIGNGSGLATNQSGGMGEGWGDFYARALLSSSDEDLNGLYASGGYSTLSAFSIGTTNYYYGIRRFPYALKSVLGTNGNSHNPLTLGDISTALINTTNGAFAESPQNWSANGAGEVHNVGEIWCLLLIEVRARIITNLGYATGNNRTLQIVTDGMKLSPVTSPTLIQERDAILAADNAGFAGADYAAIWHGFAARGAGAGAASTGTTATITVTESFATPTAAGTATNTATPTNSATASPTPTNTFTATSTATATNTATATSTATATATASPTPTCGADVSNTTSITINDNVAGSPYPSNIALAGLTGTVTKVTVDLIGMSHTFPDDVDILLVGPAGQTALIMSDAGGGGDIVNLNFTFDDAAATAIADNTQLVSGTFRPANYDTASDTFPAPAPAAGTNALLSTFNGTNPNGTWALYVRDDAAQDVGTISGGWALHITTSGCVAGTPTATSTATNTGTPTSTATNTATSTATATATATATGTPACGGAFSYTGAAVAIPDNVTAGVNFTIPVSGVGTISDLNFRFDGTQSTDPASTTPGINHSWVGDVAVSITSPLGTTVLAFDRPGVPASTFGCNSNNLAQLTLDDDGGFPAIEGQCGPAGDADAFPTGTFSPSNALSAFDGQNADGNWTINVSDLAGGDTGTARAFSLVFGGACGTPTSTATNTNTPTPTSTGTPVATSTSTATNTNTPTFTPTNTATNTATPTNTPTVTATGTPTCYTVLFDQSNNQGVNGTNSQDFETANDSFDNRGADDFVVPAGQTWTVQQVVANGMFFNGIGPADSFNVTFYTNGASAPGSVVPGGTFTGASYSNVGDAFTITLPSSLVLTSGTYWMSVQVRMDYTPGGQWGWFNRTTQSNSAAVWQNPGGGFAIPACTSWAARGATCGIDSAAPDQVFQIVGTNGAGCATATASPTPTSTFTATNTATPNNTPTNTATNTSTPTSTSTNTPTATATFTPTFTPTATSTNTSTSTPTNTPTAGPTNTSTNTPSATSTSTPSNTATATATSTATPSGSCATVSIPSTQSLTGVTATVPVNTSNMTGLGAISADMTITYNSAVLTPLANATFGVTLGSVGNSNGGGRTLSVSNPSAGTLIISLFGVTEFQGSGDLVNLNFNVIGVPGTSSALGFASFFYNEDTPCSTTSNGSLSVISGTISGVVTYGNAIGAPTPRFISNVLISGTGSPNVSTTTSFPTGAYSLGGFGAGSYTITPSKTGGQNGSISSFDSGRVAQFVAGVLTLDSTQQFVSDVSGNGGITSFDAAMIAAYTVAVPGSGQTGLWKFNPLSNSHPNVYANITGENYVGLLMGDVSGNWTDSGARPAEVSGPERSAAVTAPRLVTPADNEVIIPVSVQGVANKGIISYEFDLRYDPLVIQPQENPVEVAGTVSRGLTTAINAQEPGLLRVAVYGPMALDGDGVLLNLRFTAVGAAGSVSPLTWEKMVFNEGDPGTIITDGQVELSAAAPNQAEISGRLSTTFGAGIPNARVTLTDSTGQTYSAVSNGFGVYRFGGLQVGQTYTIRVESRSFAFSPLTVSVTGQTTDVDMIARQ